MTPPNTVPQAVAALREMGYALARSEDLLVVDGEVPGRRLIATLRDGGTWNYSGAWGAGTTGFWGLVTQVKGLDVPVTPRGSAQDRMPLVWLAVGSALWLALGVLLGVWSW